MESAFFDLRMFDLAESIDEQYDNPTTDHRLAYVLTRDTEHGALLTLSRYEVRIERSYFRALHEIQRIQAARAAHHVPPPAPADPGVAISETPSQEPMSNQPPTPVPAAAAGPKGAPATPSCDPPPSAANPVPARDLQKLPKEPNLAAGPRPAGLASGLISREAGAVEALKALRA
jgi:hypothetical protein